MCNFLDDAIPVDGHGEGLTNPDIAKWFSAHVEADEIIAQKRSGVKIGPSLEFRNERGRGQALVQDQVRDFRRVKIVGCDGIVDRQGIDGFKLYVPGVPIARVFFEANSIIKSPFLELEWTVVYEMIRFNPLIPIFFDRWKMNR